MSHVNDVMLFFIALSLPALSAGAQAQTDLPQSNLVSKSVKAIGYKVGGGSTKVDLIGTELMPQASGEAKVEAKQGKNQYRGFDQESDATIAVWCGIFDLCAVGSHT